MSEKSTTVRRRLTPQARRALIIESARQVFSQSGAGRAKIQTIAEHAGITAPLLYQHFESREALFKVAILEPLAQTVDRLARQLRELTAEQQGDRRERHIRLHRIFLDNTLELVPLLAAARFSDPVKGPELYGSMIYSQIRESLVGLMSEFSHMPVGSFELDLAMRAMVGLHFGVALETVLSGKALNHARAAEDLGRMFGLGLTHATPVKGMRKRLTAASRKAATASHANREDVNGPRKRLPKASRIDAILAAARAVFLQYGLTGAHSKQIANEVGITEAFMFRLFTSKQQIYDEAILKPLSRAFAELAEDVTQIGRANSGMAFMEKLCHLALPFFTEYGPLCIVALYSELSEGGKYYRESLAPHLKTIRKVMASQPGLIETGISTETMRRAVTGAAWGVTFDTVHWTHVVEPEVTEAILTRLFTMGDQSNVQPSHILTNSRTVPSPGTYLRPKHR
jgi:AcrR family transcriptional regulator